MSAPIPSDVRSKSPAFQAGVIYGALRAVSAGICDAASAFVSLDDRIMAQIISQMKDMKCNCAIQKVGESHVIGFCAQRATGRWN